MLKYFITSKTTRKVLTVFLTHPEEKYYARQLERLLVEPVSAVRRELRKLEKSGLLRSRHEGPVKNYQVDKGFPLYTELKGLILKTQGLGDYLRDLIRKTPDIKFAFIYGSVARGEERVTSDIDLFVIGSIDPVILNNKIGLIENELKRTIQYSLMAQSEFSSGKSEYLRRILKDKKIFLIGTDDELKKLRA